MIKFKMYITQKGFLLVKTKNAMPIETQASFTAAS
jgi:hypothetical protein